MNKAVTMTILFGSVLEGVGFPQSYNGDRSTRGPGLMPTLAAVEVRYVDETTASGTGVFINQDGYILAPKHTVENSDKQVRRISLLIQVPAMKLPGGGTASGNVVGHSAKVVCVDRMRDLAVLQPDVNPFTNDWGASNITGLEQPLAIRFAHLASGNLHRGEEISFIKVASESYDVESTTGSISLFRAPRSGIGGSYLATITDEQKHYGDFVFSAETHALVGLAYLQTPESLPPTTNSRSYSTRRRPGNRLTSPTNTVRSARLAILPSADIIDFLGANRIAFSALPN